MYDKHLSCIYWSSVNMSMSKFYIVLPPSFLHDLKQTRDVYVDINHLIKIK